ncbi:hypothetical protein BH18ACT17_BH18ACT17_00900 [soil metagenome]
MTNKNKRNKRAAQRARQASTAPASAGANEARRERKEQARQARAAQRKRAERSAFVRRAAVFSVIGVVGVGTFYWLNRAAGPRDIPQAAVAAAEEAGCTLERPAGTAPDGQHVAQGTSITYAQRPATSGQHYSTVVLPSTPDSYDQPIENEAAAVHFMEHAGVMLYYRADGDGAATPEVVRALARTAAESRMTVAAPFDGLPDGSAMAFAAWNQLQTCPASTSAEQAATIASGFSEAFACTSNAPEATAADDC